MFGVLDHVGGAVLVRLQRIILSLIGKPDISFINSNLGVGGVCSIESLAKSGIAAILDLRYEDHHDPEEVKKFSMNYMRIAVPDRDVPTISDAITATTWIKSNIDQGKKVFIHCNLGRGRGPLLTTIYLISEGIKSENAIKTIKRARSFAYFNRKQLQWISEFERQKRC